MARRKRKHPGVSWIKPDPEARTGWRLKYRDPDTGKIVKRTPDTETRTIALREDIAVRLAQKNENRRRELEAGAPKATGTALPAAITRYYAAHPKLRQGAVDRYKLSTRKFLEWAEADRVRGCDDLDRAALMRWREAVLNQPRKTAAPRGRGRKVASKEPRKPSSINSDFRKVGTALRYLVDCDLFPRLTHDDIRRAVKPIKAPTERKAYLKPAEVKRLFEAAERHDAETFKITRAELDGERKAGTTPRYEPIAPLVAFILLTGMRRGEAIDLEWKHVDLDALDATGKKVGEIEITTDSKTSKARTVGLEVSPALRRLLAAQRLKTGAKGYVWPFTRDEANAARRRLVGDYGAPANFNWQVLRVTCGTFLTNSPGIYGAASAFMSARQLGHSVEVAEKHYVGLIRGIPRGARNLESAMQIKDEVAKVIGAIATPKRDKVRQIR